MRERHPPTTGAATSITTAEAAAVAALAIPVCAIVSAYLLDQIGLRFVPGLVLPLVVAASAGTFVTVARGAVRVPGDERMLALVVAASTGWLLWLARPTLLPLSTGPDLTHHLILIRYIEEHWRLVHDPALGRVFGEMAQYTPGSHILAALSGSWSGTDGLRALHPVQAFTVGLKAGFLFLIGLRLLPPRTPRVLALIGVLLLWAAPRYFLGGFTEYAFVAQVVAELFVVAMWWAAVAWDAVPGWRGCLVFGITGVAAFLTWPVYCGPPALAFFLVVALRTDLPLLARVRHLLAAFAPIAAIAAIYLIGRIGLLQIAATGGSAPWPSVSSFGWPLVALAAVGLAFAATRRYGRPTALMLVAVVAQTVAFYVLAARSGSPQPYMAQKMFYLLLWPMAACAVMTVGEVWRIAQSMLAATDDAIRPASRFEQIGAWLCVGAVLRADCPSADQNATAPASTPAGGVAAAV